MLLRKKINLNKYIAISLLCTVALCFFVKGQKQIFGLFLVYLATVLNQFMLVEGVMELTNPKMASLPKDLRKSKNKKIITLFVGKISVLILGITLGVHLMGNKVIIPLLNYVIQIFILVFCLKTNE